MFSDSGREDNDIYVEMIRKITTPSMDIARIQNWIP
jgi:hypothetical protein